MRKISIFTQIKQHRHQVSLGTVFLKSLSYMLFNLKQKFKNPLIFLVTVGGITAVVLGGIFSLPGLAARKNYFKEYEKYYNFNYQKRRSYYEGKVTMENQWVKMCHPEGYRNLLFHYYGKEAECGCKERDNNTGKCLSYLTSSEKSVCRTQYPFWEPGTMEMSGNLVTEGNLLVEGFDKSGFHWISTGPIEKVNSALGFEKGGKDIHFAHDIYLGQDLVFSKEGSGGNQKGYIYFGSSNEGNYFFLNRDIIFCSGGTDKLKVLSSAPDDYRIKAEEGLMVDGYSRAYGLIFQGFRAYHWVNKHGERVYAR